MKNINFPSDYLAQLENQLNTLQKSIMPDYAFIVENMNISQQYAERLQAFSDIYEKIVTPIINVDGISRALNQTIAPFESICSSKINTNITEALSVASSKIFNTYSQIDFSRLFDNLTVTNEYVEMDEESSEAVNNFLNELPQEMNCHVKNDSKLSKKRFSFTSFITLLTFLLACIQFAYNVHKDHVETLEHQHEKNKTESYQTEKLQIEKEQLEQYKIIGNAISDLTVQLSELESSIAHSTISDPQEYSQEHPCTTSEFDKDVDTHKK